MGLAISADLAGASLAGGMLKTTGPPDDGPVSYVGMLLGRFGDLRPVGLRRLHRRQRQSRRSSCSVASTDRSAGHPPSSSPASAAGSASTEGCASRTTRPTSTSSRSSTRSTRRHRRPATRWTSCASSTMYFPPQRGTFWFAAGISFNSLRPRRRDRRGRGLVRQRPRDQPARTGPDGAAATAGGAGVDRARPARAVLHPRGRIHDPGRH